MIKNAVFSVLFVSCLLSCKQEPLSANAIIDRSIEVSGGAHVKNATISFDFRDIHYTAIRNDGIFKLGRTFVKGQDTIMDWLSNDAFKRTINNQPLKVPDSMVPRYSASVNSVHYFSVLPFGLNDGAVNKDYLGDVKVKEKTYHKIKVTFNEAGGGEDFEDVFIYYVDTKTFKVDYLSYSYEEDHGIGLRFREAYNERFIKGVRFVDYNNYRPKKEKEPLDNLEVLFENDGLELLSKIELKNIKVDLSQL
ncbi:DUF6503 family protein [Seonamhaeicola sp.]|uniref:DUF6503 family protein n=1 Tax=Seonamhaeicola sp. TaxID=1912245 RepID=UPI002637421C|nr:DUF6503 family protein [Seonamhaeicola sp.]